MSGCGVCLQAFPPDETAEDFREVRFRNGHTVRACLRCWCIWPDAWKPFPAFGFGRVGDLPKFPGEEEWTRQVLIDASINAAGNVDRSATAEAVQRAA